MLRREPDSTLFGKLRSAKALALGLSALAVLVPVTTSADDEMDTLQIRWIESIVELVDAEILAARLDAAARIIEATSRALPMADRSRLARAKVALAEAKVAFYRESLSRSYSEEVLTDLRSALAAAEAAGDGATLADAQDLLGVALFAHAFRASDHAEARTLFTAALETRRGLKDQRGVAETLFHLGLTREHRQDPGAADREEARRLYEESLSVAEAGGFDYEASYPIRHLAGLRDEAGDLEGARAGFERSLDLRRRTGATRVLAPALTALADVLARMGEVERARELYEEAVTTAHGIGATRVEDAARESLQRLPPAASLAGGAADGASAEIVRTIQAYDGAWDRKDRSELERVVADGFVYFNSKGAVRDREHYLGLTLSPEYALESAERSEIEVHRSGDVAVVGSRWTGHGTYRDNAFDDDQRCSLVLGRSADGWNVLSEHCTQIVP